MIFRKLFESYFEAGVGVALYDEFLTLGEVVIVLDREVLVAFKGIDITRPSQEEPHGSADLMTVVIQMQATLFLKGHHFLFQGFSMIRILSLTFHVQGFMKVGHQGT